MPRFLSSSMAAALLAAACVLAPAGADALPMEAVVPANSRDYAPAVRKLIQGAKKHITLQLYQARFYEEHPDTASNHFAADLAAAARRGVDVRVVIDTGGWNPNQKNEYNLDFVDRLAKAGVKVWEDSADDVSHQKVMTVDDDITVVGSLNWTFYSLANNHEAAAIIRSKPLNAWFRDYFCRRVAAGKPRANAQQVEESACGPLDLTATAPAESGSRRSRGGRGELAAVDVEPIPNRLFYPAVHDALLSATRSIDVVQRNIKLSPAPPMGPGGKPPLPGEPAGAVDVMVEDLIAAARRGVKVRVVLDYTEKMEDSDNSETAAYLRERGVEVYSEDPKAQTHAKMLVIDDDKVVLGSTNWTRPAVEQGNEASVLITSPEVAAAYKRFVNDLIKKGGPYEARPASIWKSAGEGP